MTRVRRGAPDSVPVRPRSQYRPPPPAPIAAMPMTAARRRHRGPVARWARPAADLLLQVLEIVPDIKRRLITALRLFGETAAKDSFEIRWSFRAMRGNRLHRVLDDRRQHAQRRVALERPDRRRHLVEHDPQREHVRSRIDRLALGLLGGHVADRPDQCVGGRHLRRRDRRRVGSRFMPQLGDPEVENLQAAAGANHDVAGLEIAMDDALLMRRRHRVGQRDRPSEELGPWHAAFRDHLSQRCPFDDLHRQEMNIRHLFDRIDRDNVRDG